MKKRFYEWLNEFRFKHPILSSIIYSCVVLGTPLVAQQGWQCFIHVQGVSWVRLGLIIGLVILGLAVLSIHEWLVHSNGRDLQEIKKERDTLNAKVLAVERVVPSAIHGILDSLKNELQLTRDDRISLYLVEGKEPELRYFCCERCSPCLSYESKSCRMRPLVKMFKKVWDEGYLYDDGFPEYEKSSKEKKSYIKYCRENYGITTDEAKEIKFKGRTYFGLRIDYHGTHLAFIIVSSLKVGISGKKAEEVKKIVTPSCQKLGAVVDALREYIPSPSKVQNRKEF